MLGNMMELKNPDSDHAPHSQVTPLVNMENVTSVAVQTAHIASKRPVLIFCRDRGADEAPDHRASPVE